jgi:hypothetical protein
VSHHQHFIPIFFISHSGSPYFLPLYPITTIKYHFIYYFLSTINFYSTNNWSQTHSTVEGEETSARCIQREREEDGACCIVGGTVGDNGVASRGCMLPLWEGRGSGRGNRCIQPNMGRRHCYWCLVRGGDAGVELAW